MSFRRPAGSFRLRERGKGEWPRPLSFSAFKVQTGSFPQSAEKVRRLGAKGTKEQGFAGVCAPSPRRPSAEKAWRLGVKGTKEQSFAGICAPSPRRPCVRVGASLPWTPCISVPGREHLAVEPGPEKTGKPARAPAPAAHPAVTKKQ